MDETLHCDITQVDVKLICKITGLKHRVLKICGRLRRLLLVERRLQICQK